MRKLLAVAAVAAALLALGVAPADAKESGWGCGGACRHVGR